MPLKEGEDEDYMLALKQEIRGTMRLLPHNIKPLAGKGGECALSAMVSVSHHPLRQWHEVR